MRIAVLGWGSLIWDRRDLMLAGPCRPTGPNLPVEFSRVSRDGQLTLVIDEDAHASRDLAHQHPRRSRSGDRQSAPAQGMPVPRVSASSTPRHTRNDTAWQRHPRALVTIETWAMRNGYRSVIWTALASNFHEPDMAGVPFSVEAAMAYLAALDCERLGTALRYFRNAPPEIRTALRTAVDQRWPRD